MATTKQVEEINAYSRTIIATGAISYMLAQIERTRCEIVEIARLGTDESVKAARLAFSTQHARFVEQIAEQLADMADLIGDYMSNQDMTMPEDEEITAAAFKYMQPMAESPPAEGDGDE